MRRRFFVVLLLLSMLSAVGPLVRADRSGSPGPRLAAQVVPLENGNFEGSFSERRDPYAPWEGTKGELTVADGWELWYDNSHVCPPYDPNCDLDRYNHRPEYKPEPVTGRVHGGQKSQKFFSSFSTHIAGFYQRVEAPAGSWVRFSIWAWAWSSNKDIADHSFQAGDYAMTVGIDPTGGTDWRSENIIWRSPITRHDQWVYLEIGAYTASGEISVWTKGSQIWPVKHNDSYWDDAQLVVLPAAPQPTPTDTPTRTPMPTPQATPNGYEPPLCSYTWSPLWQDTFSGSSLSGWGIDPARGTVAVQDGALALRNGSQAWETFPLAWVERLWPQGGDLRLSFRFSFSKPTAYGSTIGVGSEPYHGERSLAGATSAGQASGPYGAPAGVPGAPAASLSLDNLDPALYDWAAALASSLNVYGNENILNISHRSTAPGIGEFRMDLLGQTVWTGTPGDSGWHTAQLELREHTYILRMDGTEVARAVSYWRPQSLFVGNPVIVWINGYWTEVTLDDVTLEYCSTRTTLPILLRAHNRPEPESTATSTVAPSHTATPTATATEQVLASPTATPTMILP